MKLESLKLERFQKDALKKEQMFKLNGGGTPTPAGQACGTANVYPYRTWIYDYGYDVIRDGKTTYHNRTNHLETTAEKCAELQGN
jgi:natural product precursor